MNLYLVRHLLNGSTLANKDKNKRRENSNTLSFAARKYCNEMRLFECVRDELKNVLTFSHLLGM